MRGFDGAVTGIRTRVTGLEGQRTTRMSTSGSLDTYGNIAAKFDGYKDGCIVIGGFPKGHFNDKVAENLKGTYCVPGGSQEAHVILSRILYECECRAL